MNDYVNSHQDKSRNAMNKAVEASFQAWVEELRADQAQFTSEKVMNLDWTLDIIYSMSFWTATPFNWLWWFTTPEVLQKNQTKIPQTSEVGEGGRKSEEQIGSSAWGLGLNSVFWLRLHLFPFFVSGEVGQTKVQRFSLMFCKIN